MQISRKMYQSLKGEKPASPLQAVRRTGSMKSNYRRVVAERMPSVMGKQQQPSDTCKNELSIGCFIDLSQDPPAEDTA